MSYSHLSSEERYVISHLFIYGLSMREIARRLKRHHSSISREIKRNRPTYADDAVYWYDAAQEYADSSGGVKSFLDSCIFLKMSQEKT